MYLQSTGLTATAWFLITTSPLPAVGMGASLTSSGLPLGFVIHAAWFDMIVRLKEVQLVYGR
jgi:hypothetical protein